MTQNNFNWHIFSLCTLFVLGNSVITLSFNDSLLGPFFCFVLSLILLSTGVILITFLKNRKILFFITLTLICFVAVYSALITTVDYICFLKKAQLESCSVYLTIGVFVAVVLLFTFSKDSSFYKFCLFTAVLCIGVIIICFFAGIKIFSIQNIDIKHYKNFLPIEIVKNFCTIIILPFFAFFSLKSNNKSALLFFGSFFGFALLGLCLIQTVLTFGTANKIMYSYLTSISIISSGSLFTRLDGLVYFLFFTTALTKITVCTKTVFYILKQLPQKTRQG